MLHWRCHWTVKGTSGRLLDVPVWSLGTTWAGDIHLGVLRTWLVFKTDLGGMRFGGMWLPKTLTLGHEKRPAGPAHHFPELVSLPASSPSQRLRQASGLPRICTASLLRLLPTAPHSSRASVSILLLCSRFLEEWLFLFSPARQQSASVCEHP